MIICSKVEGAEVFADHLKMLLIVASNYTH
jgi:hypothetical protein